MKLSPDEGGHGQGLLGQIGLNGLLLCVAVLASFALSRLFGFGAFLIIPLFFMGRFKGPKFGRNRNDLRTDERE